MIHDVDVALRSLVKREALDGARVEIAFDAPTREWAARQNSPTLNLYLYDIREDLQRREVGWEPVRGPNGIVGERRQPPRRFRLSYLVTAWTQRPEDEHRLLSAVLAGILRNPVLPDDLLGGALGETDVPVHLTVALPPPSDRSLADVWSALGGELKASLDLVAIAPLDASVRIQAGPPVLEQTRLRLAMGGRSEVAAGPTRARTVAARSRRLGPGDVAAMEETLVAGAETVGVPRAVPPAPPSGRKRGGKGEAAPPGDAAPAATVPAATVPGRRVTIRGIPRP